MFKFLYFCILMTLVTIICCNRNLMYTIFSVIILIIFVFIFLIKHDIEFIVIAFLTIYIGAIMVLLLFVIPLKATQLPALSMTFQLFLPSTVISFNMFFSFGSHLMCKNSYLCAGDDSTFVPSSLDNTNLQIERRGWYYN